MDRSKEERIMGHFGPELYFDDLQPRPEGPQDKEITERLKVIFLHFDKMRQRNG